MDKKPEKTYEITGILCLAIALLFGISYYLPKASTGFLGAFFYTVGRGLFGITAYALPVLFIYFAGEVFLGRFCQASKRRLVHVIVLLMLIAAMLQLFAVDFAQIMATAAKDPISATESIARLWQTGIAPHALSHYSTPVTGGVVGGFIAYGLMGIAGKVGAGILCIAGTLIELILFLGLSFQKQIQIWLKAAQKASYQYRQKTPKKLEEHPDFDHLVDGALRREKAGVDLTGLHQETQQPSKKPGWQPQTLDDASSFQWLRKTLGSKLPHKTSPNQSMSIHPQVDLPAEDVRFDVPPFIQAIQNPQSEETTENIPTEESVVAHHPMPTLTGSEEGFFTIGDTEPAGAVGLSEDDLAFIEDFPTWQDQEIQPEIEQKPLLSHQPLFEFDANQNQPVKQWQTDSTPIQSNQRFEIPEFLKPTRQDTPFIHLQTDHGDSAEDIDHRAQTSAQLVQPVTSSQALFEAADNPDDDHPIQAKLPDTVIQDPIPEIQEPKPSVVPISKNITSGISIESVSKENNPSTVASPAPHAAPVKNTSNLSPEKAAASDYRFPDIQLLNPDRQMQGQNQHGNAQQLAKKLEDTLQTFGVKVQVVNITTGPSITRFELSPGPGVKVSKIVNLADDIALNLAALGLRIEAPIPGKSAIGIEIPNSETQAVHLRGLIESQAFTKATSKLSVALGRDIPGQPVICDLAKMPHLLIAGATGSGKSVCINTILMSLLYKASPEEVKLILIDPKVVELSVYNGIPHLLAPVVTDPKLAANTLNWAVVEMDRRYNLFAMHRVRDIHAFNQIAPDQDEKPLPFILLIIDELADLMMTAPGDVEDAIVRLTQKARACGIHLIIATQRPSVDVITGLIKANIPSRIAFAVSSQIDSRTILDSGGAEKLLGKGDMLYFPQSQNKPIRSQGALVTDAEVERVLQFVRSQNEVTYNDHLYKEMTTTASEKQRNQEQDEGDDDLLPAAVELFLQSGQASIAMLQRRLKIGYPRASRIVDEMELKGWIGPFEGSKPRKMKLTPAEWEMIKQGQVDDSVE